MLFEDELVSNCEILWLFCPTKIVIVWRFEAFDIIIWKQSLNCTRARYSFRQQFLNYYDFQKPKKTIQLYVSSSIVNPFNVFHARMNIENGYVICGFCEWA
jgi:hypothetical protein